jgi:dihydrofolate reductase
MSNIPKRKLLLEMQMSFDGFVGDTREQSPWMVWPFTEDWTWDEPLQDYHTQLISSADVVILSGKMAEGGFIDHWADIATRQENPESVFAASITNAEKVIFSHDLTESRWRNSRIATRSLEDEVNDLKRQPGKNIIAFGGAEFAASLIAADLVDEFHFMVNPAVIGEGKTIFHKLRDTLPLTLLHSTTYGQGMVVMSYSRR